MEFIIWCLSLFGCTCCKCCDVDSNIKSEKKVIYSVNNVISDDEEFAKLKAELDKIYNKN